MDQRFRHTSSSYNFFTSSFSCINAFVLIFILWSSLPLFVSCLVVFCCRLVLSRVRLFVTLWTRACQSPLSMEFLAKNTVVGCHFLRQRIFLTQGSNSCLLHWQADSLPLRYQGSSWLYFRAVLKSHELDPACRTAHVHLPSLKVFFFFSILEAIAVHHQNIQVGLLLTASR